MLQTKCPRIPPTKDCDELTGFCLCCCTFMFRPRRVFACVESNISKHILHTNTHFLMVLQVQIKHFWLFCPCSVSTWTLHSTVIHQCCLKCFKVSIKYAQWIDNVRLSRTYRHLLCTSFLNQK